MSAVLLAIGVGLAGGLGAVLRFLLDGWVRRRLPGFGWGTVWINVSGSFLLGVLTAAGASVVSAPWLTVIGVGLLGGYTTFSAASQEAWTLLSARRWATGLGYAIGTLTLAVAAAAAGWNLALRLTG